MGTEPGMAAHAESFPAASSGSEKRESKLTPTLTKKMLLLFIVGDILGGGIYAGPARWRARSAARSGAASRWPP